VTLRVATPADAAAIAAIYASYVEGSSISFETVAPGAAQMEERIQAGGDLYPWLIAEEDGETLGYAYASAFRARPAYRYTVETSVYLASSAHGRGLGRQLYGKLIQLLEVQGFAQAIGAITLPNAASVRLHESLGFAPAGVYRQVGYKMGEWWDVGLWQRALAPATNPPRDPIPFAETRLI
jgi:L-amino acid N-acyltransferase YncA